MTSHSQTNHDTLLRLPDVQKMVGLKRSSIYRAVKAGGFPVPVKIGTRAVGFSEAQIQQWIADRIGGKPSAGR